MKLKGIGRAAALLGLSVLAAVILYGGSARVVVAGALYLMIAAFLSLACLFLISTSRAQQKKGTTELETLRARALAFVSCGWQAAIIGWLNLFSVVFEGSERSVVTGYAFVAVFVVLSYQLVALADRPKQEGGSKPLNYLGRPRSRRLLFCAFVMYPMVPLVILGLAWSHWERCPIFLRVPQLWFLLVALSSTLSAGLIFQRYRTAATDKVLRRKFAFAVLCVFVCAAAVQVFVVYDLWIALLSFFTSVSLAASMYWLWLGGEDQLLSRRQMPSDHDGHSISSASSG